jgi:putative transposase
MARVVVPGYPHHVTHRGNRRENVFFSDGQRQQYLAFLKDYAHKAQMEVWAFCLMSNHVHLIVTPRREDSLARGVGLAHRRYAAWLNRQEKLSGHLWANRFFSTPLDDTHHWAAVRYVERNPVRAKMTAKAEDYPWSSAAAHVLGREDDLLAPSRPYPGPVEDWGRWLSEPEEEEDMEGLRLATRTGRPCGSDGFVRMLENLLARTLRPKKRGPEPGFRNQEQKGQLDLLETER